MNKNKGIIITIVVLVLLVIVEGILLLTGALTKVPKNENGADILVSLNDGTTYTVNDIYNDMKASYALNTILSKVDDKILTTEYKDKKSEVEDYAKNILANLKANYKSDDELLSALQNYGYNTVDDYLNVVKTSQYTTYAAEDYAKTLIKEDEIKKYYDEKIYGDMSGMHILVKPASTSNDDLNKAKAKAEEVIKAIKEDVKNGTDIQEAFKKYQDNKDVTFEDLGTFNYSQMDEAFSIAAYALKNNEMSSTPVKSSFGYHVILKTAEFEKPSYDESKDSILTTLASEKNSSDSTISAKAMKSLREKYGFTINDSEIENYYNRYINRQINTTTTK
jgi:foldase protein PrsA